MAIVNPYYTTEVHGPCRTHDVGDLVLEEGDTFRGCTPAYTTFGTPNAAKDNAILVPTWYGGNYSIMRDAYVAPGGRWTPSGGSS